MQPKAYVIVEIEVTDPATYEAYKKQSPAAIAQYGGQYLSRGGQTTGLEGGWQPQRLVLLEFPSAEQALAWWNSSEYAGPKALRQASTYTRMVMLEGTPPVF
jgi:uncharacterized protein (DUF1330 family)